MSVQDTFFFAPLYATVPLQAVKSFLGNSVASAHICVALIAHVQGIYRLLCCGYTSGLTKGSRDSYRRAAYVGRMLASKETKRT